jgi:hypothetical protein
MHWKTVVAWIAPVALLALPVAFAQDTSAKKQPLAKLGDEKKIGEFDGLKIKVRVMLPQKQEADVLCLGFLKNQAGGNKVLDTIQKLDDGLGGLIAALRNRDEFCGDARETILITPPAGGLTAQKLMLIGWGDGKELSLQTIRSIGTVLLRESARLGVKSVAFGAALRDQGNEKFETGDVAREVIQGVILAFDTEKRLQKEGLGAGVALEELIYLAGPEYYNNVVPLAEKGLKDATTAAKARSNKPYTKKK